MLVVLMLKKFLKPTRAVVLLSFLVFLCLTPFAQNQSSSGTKKTKAGNTCDGALDLVPDKPMTFIRKRRPSQGETRQPSSPDSKELKTDPKPEKPESVENKKPAKP
jgi:hypothetical protein